jgi:hypothetical protein
VAPDEIPIDKHATETMNVGDPLQRAMALFNHQCQCTQAMYSRTCSQEVYLKHILDDIVLNQRAMEVSMDSTIHQTINGKVLSTCGVLNLDI